MSSELGIRVSFGEEMRSQTGVYDSERRLVGETGVDDGVTIECDPANPLVEGGILERGVEFLRDHTILALDVVHVDEQIEGLGPASEQWPETEVAL